MKVILYMATSLDGYIAKSDDDTSWVSEVDWDNFANFIEKTGVIIMGRNTYEIAKKDNQFPYEKALNIVMTSDEKLLKNSETKEALFSDKLLNEVINLAKEKGFSEILLIGGEKLNTSFLNERLIDEIYLSVHPLIVGKGKKLFSKNDTELKLQLVDVVKKKEDLVQLHYKVLK